MRSAGVSLPIVCSWNPSQEIADHKVGHRTAEPFAGILIRAEVRDVRRSLFARMRTWTGKDLFPRASQRVFPTFLTRVGARPRTVRGISTVQWAEHPTSAGDIGRC